MSYDWFGVILALLTFILGGMFGYILGVNTSWRQREKRLRCLTWEGRKHKLVDSGYENLPGIVYSYGYVREPSNSIVVVFYQGEDTKNPRVMPLQEFNSLFYPKVAPDATKEKYFL